MDNEDIAKRLDACKLIVVNYGTFSEFTGKAAVPTRLIYLANARAKVGVAHDS